MAKLGIQKRGHGIARIMGNTVPPQMKQSSMMGPDSMASSPMGSIPGMKKGGMAQQAAIAISKKESGKYNKDGMRMKEGGSTKPGLWANINRRKKLGISRPKSKSTISAKAYANMKAGFPKKKK